MQKVIEEEFLLTSLSPWTVICFLREALSVKTFPQDSRWHVNVLGTEGFDGREPGRLLFSPGRFPSSWPSPLFGCCLPALFTKVSVFLLVFISRSPDDFETPAEFR